MVESLVANFQGGGASLMANFQANFQPNQKKTIHVQRKYQNLMLKLRNFSVAFIASKICLQEIFFTFLNVTWLKKKRTHTVGLASVHVMYQWLSNHIVQYGKNTANTAHHTIFRPLMGMLFLHIIFSFTSNSHPSSCSTVMAPKAKKGSPATAKAAAAKSKSGGTAPQLCIEDKQPAEESQKETEAEANTEKETETKEKRNTNKNQKKTDKDKVPKAKAKSGLKKPAAAPKKVMKVHSKKGKDKKKQKEKKSPKDKERGEEKDTGKTFGKHVFIVQAHVAVSLTMTFLKAFDV